MSNSEEQRDERLAHLIGRELEREVSADSSLREEYYQWLAREARENQTSAERNRTSELAHEFAKRMGSRIKSDRISRRLPLRPLRKQPAGGVYGIGTAINFASTSHCAPLLDMRVAAGSGRALWDEPCDEWIEVPLSFENGRYIGLRVAGDSMVPVLHSGDVILVKLDAVPAEDDLVVAQRSENEYVVKRVASISDRSMQLESLNPAFERFDLDRRPGSILGTVIARFQSS